LNRDSCYFSTSALRYAPCDHCGSIRWSINYYPGTSLSQDKGKNCVHWKPETQDFAIQHCEDGYYEFEKYDLDLSILDIFIHQVDYFIPSNFFASLEVKSAASQSCINNDPSMNRECRFEMQVSVENTHMFGFSKMISDSQGATLRFDFNIPVISPSMSVDMRKITYSQTSLADAKTEKVSFTQSARAVAYPLCHQEANVKIHWGHMAVPYTATATITYRSGKIENKNIAGDYRGVMAAKSVIEYSANEPLNPEYKCVPKSGLATTLIPPLGAEMTTDSAATPVLDGDNGVIVADM